MSLREFVRESNRIEGILRAPSAQEIVAHKKFLALERISISDLIQFVNTIQPDAHLRTHTGMDVIVGRYRAPPGGVSIVESLEHILRFASRGHDEHEIFMIHYLYENLHPFTDGNGRSGRALWLWMMGGDSRRLFLHEWYYQSLRTRIDSFNPHPNLLRPQHI